MRSLENVVGPVINIYGGMAGDDAAFTGTFVFTYNQSSDYGIDALILDEDKINLHGMAISGWKLLEICIKDNGTGIPQSIREKLFNPFFTTKPAGEGSGLGLSLSYDIVVKQHGGDIKSESEERKCTEFVITLPKSP